ncbi:MAG: type II toxin-antitoxin system RelE/ParE family toxin [Deltaproteobacteria bacterium]|nr:type II toxin-antitoxin system RelE/ParE family toxin [Deltaproteobacteria bacterium]
MSYRVSFHPSAQKELSRLPNDIFERVRTKILALSENPRPDNSRKLVGSRDWRIRVGTWRVVYRIDDDAREITITVIGHRREVYR